MSVTDQKKDIPLMASQIFDQRRFKPEYCTTLASTMTASQLHQASFISAEDSKYLNNNEADFERLKKELRFLEQGEVKEWARKLAKSVLKKIVERPFAPRNVGIFQDPAHLSRHQLISPEALRGLSNQEALREFKRVLNEGLES